MKPYGLRQWCMIIAVILLFILGIQPAVASTGSGDGEFGTGGQFTVKTKKPRPPTYTPVPKTPTEVLTATSIFHPTPTPKETLVATKDTSLEFGTNDATEDAYVTEVQLTGEALATRSALAATEKVQAKKDFAEGKPARPGVCSPPQIFAIPMGLILFVPFWVKKKKREI